MGCATQIVAFYKERKPKMRCKPCVLLRRTLVDRKIAFLHSTSVLRFFVGLQTFYCAELGDLEIVSWR